MFWKRKKSKPASRINSRKSALRFECLEDRLCLSASSLIVNADLHNIGPGMSDIKAGAISIIVKGGLRERA